MALPPLINKDPSDMNWCKGNIYDNFTFRSSLAQECRNAIEQNPQYKSRMQAYLIENNPYNPCQYTQQELHKIEMFFNNNNEGNSNPQIQFPHGQYKPLNSMLDTKVMRAHSKSYCKSLVGHKETFCKCRIPEGTILGQYHGAESTKWEWNQRFKGTKISKLKYRMQFLCFTQGPFDNDQCLELFIDPFDGANGHVVGPLHRINDCRNDITKHLMTEKDKQRQNCEFVSILVNGYPTILVKTTKQIEAFQSLWIYYGDHYGLLFANKPDVLNKNHKDILNINKLLIKPKPKPFIKKIIPMRKLNDGGSNVGSDRKRIQFQLLREKVREMTNKKKQRSFTDFFAMSSLDELLNKRIKRQRRVGLFDGILVESEEEDDDEMLDLI